MILPVHQVSSIGWRRPLLIMSLFAIVPGCFVYDGSLLDDAQGAASLGGASTGGSMSLGSGGSDTGGTSNMGGADSNTGGIPGSSGGTESGSGGTNSGTGGGSTVSKPWFDFAEGLQGFFGSGGVSSTAEWDPTTGDPEVGAASLLIEISAPDESGFFTRVLPSPLDLSGELLTAQVKLQSGLSGNPLCPGAAFLLAKSGEASVFARGEWQNLAAADGWVTISMSLDSPDYPDPKSSSFDASDVREIGVGISSGGVGCGAPDWQSAQVLVDSIDY